MWLTTVEDAMLDGCSMARRSLVSAKVSMIILYTHLKCTSGFFLDHIHTVHSINRPRSYCMIACFIFVLISGHMLTDPSTLL